MSRRKPHYQHISRYSAREAVPPDELERRLHGTALPDNKGQPISEGAREARALLEKARQIKQANQPEKTMPDLKTALSTALSVAQKQSLSKIVTDWDDEPKSAVPAQTQVEPEKQLGRVLFQVTNNVTRSTFYFVRDNPGLTSMQVQDKLEVQGFKRTSTSSIISQLLRQNLIKKDGDRLYSVVPEYVPVKCSSVMRRREEQERKDAAKAQAKAQKAPQRKKLVVVKRKTTSVSSGQGIGDLLAAKLAEPTIPVTTAPWSAETHANGLTLAQAKALYSYLHNIFGA